jgi:hypothetical protein
MRTLLVPFLVGIAQFCLVSCSIHPLPEDFSRASTVDIVKSIRCEALAGLDSLRPEEKTRAATIIKTTVIGYDFNFDITEKNGANGAGDNPRNSFLTFQKGTKFTADLTGNASLTRENTRRFIVIESLAAVAKPENRALCSNRTARENWTYPIAGVIGVDEIVRTYLRLQMVGELAKVNQGDLDPLAPNDFGNSAAFGNGIVFADDLTFTTHFDAGAKNTLTVDAVVGKLKVTNASIQVSASRDDVHKVAIALTRKDVGKKGSGGLMTLAAATKDRLEILANDNARDPRTQALLIQMDENARTRVAMELYRRRSLNDIDNAPAEALGQRLLDVLKVP